MGILCIASIGETLLTDSISCYLCWPQRNGAKSMNTFTENETSIALISNTTTARKFLAEMTYLLISFSSSHKHGRWWGTSSNVSSFYEVTLKCLVNFFNSFSFPRDELANIENRILEKKIAEKKKEELRKKNIAVRSVNSLIMFWPTICLPLDVWRLQESPAVLSARFRCWGGGGITSKSKTCRRWLQVIRFSQHLKNQLSNARKQSSQKIWSLSSRVSQYATR